MRNTAKITLFLTLVLFLCGSPAAAAPLVYDGHLDHEAGAFLKLRNFSLSRNIQGYDAELKSGAGQSQVDFYRGARIDGKPLYDQWSPSNTFSFGYDGAGTAFMSLDTGNHRYEKSVSLSHNPLFNYLQIDVVARDPGAVVGLDNVRLNGDDLGDFSGSGWNSWHLAGMDFSSPFTLTGTLNLDGLFSGSQEKNKAVIGFGYSQEAGPAPASPSVPVPASAWLLGSGFLGLVGIGRKLKN